MSLEFAIGVPAPAGQSLDRTVLRVLELEKRTLTNDSELRRGSYAYPLLLREKCVFKHALVSG